MTECWSEGNLRAYHDGELSAVDLDRLAGHLAECERCRTLANELSMRAARVSGLLSLLPDPSELQRLAPRREPAVPFFAHKVAAMLSVAAGVVLAVTLLVAEWGVPRLTADRFGAAGRAKPAEQLFLALDDEPFEAAMIMRVALGQEEIPADVVFSPDGRVRAIRLVGNRFVQ